MHSSAGLFMGAVSIESLRVGLAWGQLFALLSWDGCFGVTW